MFHIVESCPLTKLNGGLSRLHSADENAVSWLTNYGKWHAYEKKKTGDKVERTFDIRATPTFDKVHRVEHVQLWGQCRPWQTVEFESAVTVDLRQNATNRRQSQKSTTLLTISTFNFVASVYYYYYYCYYYEAPHFTLVKKALVEIGCVVTSLVVGWLSRACTVVKRCILGL